MIYTLILIIISVGAVVLYMRTLARLNQMEADMKKLENSYQLLVEPEDERPTKKSHNILYG